MQMYNVYLFLAIGFYYSASKIIFDHVYATSKIIVDELYHIPQGIAYCQRNFTHWESKITTLPGLYFVSSCISNYFKCSVYNLRFVNLLASMINLYLFSSILKFTYVKPAPIKTILQAFSLAILPPLYFFSHVYYSDTLSLTFLLTFSRLCFNNTHKGWMLFSGLFSVLMRQTNIVWIIMIGGHKVLDMILRTSRVFGNNLLTNLTLSENSGIREDIDSSKLKRYYDLYDIYIAIRYHLSTNMKTFFRYATGDDYHTLAVHGLIVFCFGSFVMNNRGIVVGDKTAHEATIHIPQMFYFLVFYGIFGLPHVMNKLGVTLKLIQANKLKVIFATLLFLIIVHYNTMTHPYLLADNRHYTFYVWNRWYGKYNFAKYVSVPPYVFLLVNLYANLKDQNCISFLLPFSICSFLVLSLQKMIEVRYFLMPYLILRLRFAKPSYWVIIFELLWYFAINGIVFYNFFTKEIMWQDYTYPQRLIW